MMNGVRFTKTILNRNLNLKNKKKQQKYIRPMMNVFFGRLPQIDLFYRIPKKVNKQ
jgi:hypothetical protein